MSDLQWTLPWNGKRCFIVEMLRYGDRDNHSYVVGAWSDYYIAEAEAQINMISRGGKYDAIIYECVIDSGGTSLVRNIQWGDHINDREELEDIIKSRVDFLKHAKEVGWV